MNAVFTCSLFVAAFVAVTLAHHKELCYKTDEELAEELVCIGNNIPPSTNAAFNRAVRKLHCPDRSCAIHMFCAGGGIDAAMAEYFTPQQIEDIHNAATLCDPDSPDDD